MKKLISLAFALVACNAFAAFAADTGPPGTTVSQKYDKKILAAGPPVISSTLFLTQAPPAEKIIFAKDSVPAFALAELSGGKRASVALTSISFSAQPITAIAQPDTSGGGVLACTISMKGSSLNTTMTPAGS